jgi:glyoxylase-like metal-dependent hydrolase (beta-lactamase superfamily II)
VDQIKERSVPRVEIFKMPGGTEYIIHDVDENNKIIGKARFSGHVKVSELMSVDGFGGHSILDDVGPNCRKSKSFAEERDLSSSADLERWLNEPERILPPPSFHPPSFGVTVLGNSHGFDKSGSVSGYVLWINGRGVMIDPPPYSSATLEREGIRPRTIVGIILTHCHADHDAGAFQKVLTGSPVVVITTPTIYKSFIRKYAALSALSPALLRHSHRYKPAIIGEALRFQGATFYFTYTLHTIPCVGFRVEWRGRSMVFTGDHFNSPPAIDKLQETGILSKARADDLRNLPLQDTDLLLHEAGAPPIHTPLEVLLQLPKEVKKRLYVVHTSALPAGCELRVAPTGTAGTIRLDQIANQSDDHVRRGSRHSASSDSCRDGEYIWNGHSEYESISEEAAVANANVPSRLTVQSEPRTMMNSFQNLDFIGAKERQVRSTSCLSHDPQSVPLVSMRPASSTDAWFILNLLSAVPFLSSLSYAFTMEVLETAKVDAYAPGAVVVPSTRRSQLLCVVWEGTCTEKISQGGNPRNTGGTLKMIAEGKEIPKAVWHAGDWTGPVALQPDLLLSGESDTSDNHDVVALSTEGVKVITVEFSSLQTILKSGSPLYRKYLDRKAQQGRAKRETSFENGSTATDELYQEAVRSLNVLELLNGNSALRKLSAVQKRHLESLAEGPICFQPGERLWRSGAPVDRAFIMVSGTASFVPKRRNAGSAAVQAKDIVEHDRMGDLSVSESMRADAQKVMRELGVRQADSLGGDESSMSSAEHDDQKVVQFDHVFNRSVSNDTPFTDAHDYAKLSRGLQKRADYLLKEGSREGSVVSNISTDDSLNDMDSCDNESEGQVDYTFTDDADAGLRSKRNSIIRRRSSRARFANKVLGRLYSRRAFTGGLVFSRGHFLGDVSKMVAGLLSSEGVSEVSDDYGSAYGFGDKPEGADYDLLENMTDLVIHEREGDHHVMHSSTLTAGKRGCVVLVFPKASLIPFLDEYPGLLLSVLGTQVVI